MIPILHIMRRIETKEELIDHLTRVCSVYTKNYKLYGTINKMLQITGGILGPTALLALVPIIPVFITVISITPVVVGIITNATKGNNKAILLKSNHRKFKVLLTYVESQYKSNEQQLIKDVFKQITNIHAAIDYTEPILESINCMIMLLKKISCDECKRICTRSI